MVSRRDSSRRYENRLLKRSGGTYAAASLNLKFSFYAARRASHTLLADR